jgi:hypothetical protein
MADILIISVVLFLSYWAGWAVVQLHAAVQQRMIKFYYPIKSGMECNDSIQEAMDLFNQFIALDD